MELELRGITKRFGPLTANDGISIAVAPGQVHALLGENGAGKTTLMNVLYGLTQPDEGEILTDGKPQKFGSPKDAIEAGIGMVHQHFMLVPVFTVAENVTLGIEEAGPGGVLNRRKTRRDVADLSHRYGLDVDPDALVAFLSRRQDRIAPASLAQVNCPTMVVLGERDFIGSADRLVAALPDVRFVSLAGVDHFATTADFGAIDAVVRFLTEA